MIDDILATRPTAEVWNLYEGGTIAARIEGRKKFRIVEVLVLGGTGDKVIQFDVGEWSVHAFLDGTGFANYTGHASAGRARQVRNYNLTQIEFHEWRVGRSYWKCGATKQEVFDAWKKAAGAINAARSPGQLVRTGDVPHTGDIVNVRWGGWDGEVGFIDERSDLPWATLPGGQHGPKGKTTRCRVVAEKRSRYVVVEVGR